jgi:glycosyltransferase involved in cell wall biosynthesis
VCAQRVDGHEVVVVNDAGPDVSAVVADAAEVLPVRLVTFPRHRGLAAARRAGIAAARGRYVAFLDDDDVWLPQHLPVALAALEGGGTDLVYTTCLVAHALAVPGQPVPARHRFALPFDPELLAVTNVTPVISVVARAFNPDDSMVDARGAMQEDWAMWLGLVRGHRWRMRHVDSTTTVYHRIPAAVSMTGAVDATPHVRVGQGPAHGRPASRPVLLRAVPAGDRRRCRWPDGPSGRRRQAGRCGRARPAAAPSV